MKEIRSGILQVIRPRGSKTYRAEPFEEWGTCVCVWKMVAGNKYHGQECSEAMDSFNVEPGEGAGVSQQKTEGKIGVVQV